MLILHSPNQTVVNMHYKIYPKPQVDLQVRGPVSVVDSTLLWKQKKLQCHNAKGGIKTVSTGHQEGMSAVLQEAFTNQNNN